MIRVEICASVSVNSKIIITMAEVEKEVTRQDEELPLTHMLMEECTEDESFNPLYHQILAAIGPILLTVFGALVSGYSAILLPQLKDEDSIIKATTAEESWIASLAILPMAIGCVFGGWSMEKHGRVNANIISAVLAVIGWGFIYYASTISILLTGRFISGFAVGVACPGATCFLGEVSYPKYRGLFLSLTAFAISLGLLVAHIMGTFLHWKTVAAICAFLPVICIMIFAILPESHMWYVKRNDFKTAQKTFFWYRGRNDESINEFLKIFNDKTKTHCQQRTTKELLIECCKPQFIKPFLIMNLYFITSQITGNNAVSFYTVNIMKDTVPSLDKYTATIMVDMLRAVMSIIGCILIKKYKIRPLTMISGLGVASSLCFISFFVYISQSHTDNNIITFMPMIGFISYIIFISIGLMPLPWAICSELFPPATRGIGGGISICNNFFAFFLVVNASPDMFENLGIVGTFIIYAVLVLLCTIILYFVLPETKNKTLKDIEEFFSGDYKKSKVHSVKA